MAVFFKRLTHQEAYFKDKGQRVTYQKGQTFVRPEDENPWVYFLDSGLIEIAYGFSNGNNRLLGYFFPGVVFAQNGSFFTNNGSGLEYTAADKSMLYRLPREQFFQMLRDDPKCNQEYVDLLLRNQFVLIERVAYMGERNIERMVIRLLIGLGRYYGHEVDGSYVVDIPITQETVARFTHSTRESVSKTLRPLIRNKTISLEKKRLTIKDISALELLLAS